MDKLKVHRNTLLLIAGIVWSIAGFNVLRLGAVAYPGYVTFLNLLLSAAVYGVFQIFVFGKMVKKHTNRITQYEEDRQFLLKFFDVKSFIIMAFMITFGVWLRNSGCAPTVFIAVFYTGLGAALLTAGVIFLINYIRECRGMQGI